MMIKKQNFFNPSVMGRISFLSLIGGACCRSNPASNIGGTGLRLRLRPRGASAPEGRASGSERMSRLSGVIK
ncbi:MAG: hypothetical protein Q8P64_22560, partial [Deltaproteobacteria bacterium]|nr:hypothetical protein [Deltaproteobacteria bacterium]